MSDRDRRIGVAHLIDSLATGGAERMAVNLVNALPRERYRPFLVTTRADGPLDAVVAADVGRLRLARRGRFDLGAINRLATWMASHDIRVAHAHSSSVFLACAARALVKRRAKPAVVWHDHYGRHDTDPRPTWLYRWPARAVDGIVAVNPKLAAWSRDRLGVRPDRVWYLRNFVLPPDENRAESDVELPGGAGGRIACVANFRVQKDHANLVRAMAKVVAQNVRAHLLLIGTGDETRSDVEALIARQGLGARISVLGRRDDVPAVLRTCDIGVLPSSSEGLPLALLEYGQAGLAVVSTAVGECAEVLDNGRAGVLVPARDPDALADGLLLLLDDAEARRRLSTGLQRRVTTVYGVPAAVARLDTCYRTVLGETESGSGRRDEDEA